MGSCRLGPAAFLLRPMADMTSELDIIHAVRELLESESTMTLATVGGDGNPYIAPLFFLLRDDLTLYWLSAADSRHSLHLRARPQAAVAVYASVNRWEKIRGAQMEGVVARYRTRGTAARSSPDISGASGSGFCFRPPSRNRRCMLFINLDTLSR